MKQPKSPSTDEWINKHGIPIQWNFFDNKTDGCTVICHNMNETTDIVSESNQ